MARTAGTSRLLTFVPVPCIPVVLRTVSHWFACVHVIRGFCHYRRTWCCRESGVLRPTRSWTSRAEAVAAKDKCLRHWIFWNLVLRKGLLHTVAVVIVKLAVPDGSRHAPFEPFAGNPADRVSAAVQSTSEGAMAAHNRSSLTASPQCILQRAARPR